MGKNLHEIENLFRKALEDNEEYPSQNVWDEIEKKLDRENVVSIKNKYNLLKKVAFLLLILLTGLSVYVWVNQDRNSVKPNNNITGNGLETKSKNNILAEESGTDTLHKPLHSLTIYKNDKLKHIAEVVVPNLQKHTDSLVFNKIINPKQIAKQSSVIIDKSISKVEKESALKSFNPIRPKNISNKTTKENIAKPNKSGESNLHDTSKSGDAILLTKKGGNLIKRNSNKIVEFITAGWIEGEKQVFDNYGAIQFNKKLPATESFDLKKGSGIKMNSSALFDTKESLQNRALAKINPEIKIETATISRHAIKSRSQSRFAITAFYSHDITFQKFVNSDPQNSNSTNFDIPASESHASTLGALVNYSIGKHWGLQSGITLGRSEFELEYEKPETLYAQHDNSGSIEYKLASPLGDAFVKPSFSNNPNIGDSVFSKSTAYNLQYSGIPLALNYNFKKGRFTLNALGGLSANFLTNGQLTTELEYGNDIEEETTDKIYGLKSMYFSGLAGIGVDYNMYKKLYITFSPTLHFALSSINNNIYVQSYPNSLGLGLGLKMKL